MTDYVLDLGQARPRLPRKAALLVFGIMFVFSCLTLPKYLRIKKSLQWPMVPGVITRSYLRSGFCMINMPCSNGEIAYRYRVGSSYYESTLFDLGPSSAAAKDGWQRVLDHYPVGKTVNVYYEPSSPALAVLNPGLAGELESAYKLNLLFIGGSALGFLICFLLYDDGEQSTSLGLAESRKLS